VAGMMDWEDEFRWRERLIKDVMPVRLDPEQEYYEWTGRIDGVKLERPVIFKVWWEPGGWSARTNVENLPLVSKGMKAYWWNPTSSARGTPEEALSDVLGSLTHHELTGEWRIDDSNLTR
jgi:hypothetical protein